MSFTRLAVSLLFLAIAAAACLMPAQSDTYWQLRAGQEIATSGRVLLQDTFTHTVRGGYWPNHEWATEVVFYLLHRAGGMPLLTAFVAGLVVCAWAFVWPLMKGHAFVRIGMVLSLLITSAGLWSVRPQLVTLACLGFMLWMLVRGKERWLPLLFLVWANFHGGVTLGAVALAGGLAGLVFVERGRWKSAALVFASCVAVACLTPLGVSIWTEVPQMLARLSAYDVQEWRRPSLLRPANAPFWLAAAALVVMTVRRWRELKRDDAILVGAALALLATALKSQRNVSPFLLAVAPALTVLLPATIRAWTPRPRRERPGFNVALLGAAAAASAFIVAAGWSRPFERLNWQPISPQVAGAIASCRGNLYNQYDNGGYLVWFLPNRPVFMDSRQDPFPAGLVVEHIRAERTGDYRRLFERQAIECAAIPPESLVAASLERDGWRTLERDDRWVVMTPDGRP